MTRIITKLSDELIVSIRTAHEIWVAVALMSFDGLKLIMNNAKPSCQQNYLIGIDLPTDPKALKSLNELQLKSDLKVRLFTDKECFHPKLYLMRDKNKYSAFVGSANCTNGGLSNNIELTINTIDQTVCKQLIKWFDQYYKTSKPLTTAFIDQYETEYLERQQLKAREEKTAKKEKQILNEEFEANLKAQNEFIRMLKQHRKDKEYDNIVVFRQRNIKDLRKALDYPGYQNIDLKSYFDLPELGSIRPSTQNAVKQHLPQIKKLLKYLSNENVEINKRYDRALNGDLKIEGVGKAFISKILVVHRPDLYYIKNGKSDDALQKYGGIQFPRGLTEGEKYKITCKLLIQICKDTNIKDLSVLDNYLYDEGSGNIR